MRIAHFSDLHVLALAGVPFHRFLNKRLTGWANLRFSRAKVHRTDYVRAIAREVTRLGVDHVLISGDLTNLGLETEFGRVRELLTSDLGLDPARVTIVPGNHDVYTRGAATAHRFAHYFQDWQASDLPAFAVDTAGGRFPIVKLREHVAIIGLSSAVPRAPFIAAGALGRVQLAALAQILAHAEVKRRFPLLVLHHPIVFATSWLKAQTQGLRDAPSLRSILSPLDRGLVVHGHLHRRVWRTLTTQAGRIDQIGATSASLDDPRVDRMAGFNLYDVEREALRHAEARVLHSDGTQFVSEPIPTPT